MKLCVWGLAAALAVPAFGQSTTTTTTTPLPAPTTPPPAPAPAAVPAPAPPPAVAPPAAQAPAPSTVVIDRGDRGDRRAQTVIVDGGRTERRSPMATVATNALFGGGAGLLVGVGIGLIEQGNYLRDISIGTGIGVVAGAIVGGVTAYNQTEPTDRIARDDLGTPAREKDRARPMVTVAQYAFRF